MKSLARLTPANSLQTGGAKMAAAGAFEHRAHFRATSSCIQSKLSECNWRVTLMDSTSTRLFLRAVRDETDIILVISADPKRGADHVIRVYKLEVGPSTYDQLVAALAIEN